MKKKMVVIVAILIIVLASVVPVNKIRVDNSEKCGLKHVIWIKVPMKESKKCKNRAFVDSNNWCWRD